MSEQCNYLSQTHDKIPSFNCKKRKNKCLNKSLNTTFIKPRTKKNNAEKPCKVKEKYDVECERKERDLVHQNIEQTKVKNI